MAVSHLTPQRAVTAHSSYFHYNSSDIMANPVTLTCCGITIEQDLVKNTLGSDCKCPNCGAENPGTLEHKVLREQIYKFLQANPSYWNQVHFSRSLQKKLIDMLTGATNCAKQLSELFNNPSTDPRIYQNTLTDEKTSTTLLDLMCKSKALNDEDSKVFTLALQHITREFNIDSYFSFAKELIKNNKISWAKALLQNADKLQYSFDTYVAKLITNKDYQKLTILLKAYIENDGSDKSKIKIIFDSAIANSDAEMLLTLQNNGINLPKFILSLAGKPTEYINGATMITGIFLAAKKYQELQVFFHQLLLQLRDAKTTEPDKKKFEQMLATVTNILSDSARTGNQAALAILDAIYELPDNETKDKLLLYALKNNLYFLSHQLILGGVQLKNITPTQQNIFHWVIAQNLPGALDTVVRSTGEHTSEFLQERDSSGHTPLDILFLSESKNRTEMFKTLKPYITAELLQKLKSSGIKLFGIFSFTKAAKICFPEAATLAADLRGKSGRPQSLQETLYKALKKAIASNNADAINYVAGETRKAKLFFNSGDIIVDAILNNPIPPDLKTLWHVFKQILTIKDKSQLGFLQLFFQVCDNSTQLLPSSEDTRRTNTGLQKHTKLIELFKQVDCFTKRKCCVFDLLSELFPEKANNILTSIVDWDVTIPEAYNKYILDSAMSMGNLGAVQIFYPKVYPKGCASVAENERLLLLAINSKTNSLPMLECLVKVHELVANEHVIQKAGDVLGPDAAALFKPAASSQPQP